MLQRLVIAVYKMLPRNVTSRVVRAVKPTFIIGVVAVVFDERNRVLLLKHTYHAPPWRLPGGILERGESPVQTARREVQEEANCVVRPLCIVDAALMSHSFDVAVVARLETTNPFVPNAEVSELMWVDVGDLPPIPSSQITFIQRASHYLQSVPHEST